MNGPFLLIVALVFLTAGAIFLIRLERSRRQSLGSQLARANAGLEEAFEKLQQAEARLETTFAGMVEGVLLTNDEGEMLHVNPAFREMFALQKNVEGRSALEVLASVACDDALQEVIRQGRPVEREIVFEKPRRRIFQVHFSPIKTDGRLSGVAGIFHDLTEIHRLEEIRRDFIANLSHELKTPLTAIRGFSETLLDGAGSLPEETRKQIAVIFRNASDLTRLMENLLNLSRIESGREELLLEPISLKSFVGRLLERFSTQAEVKQIQVTNEIPENAPPLQADSGKLNQILGNLLDNALKYTPEGGKVWIRSNLAGGTYQIEVEDNGPGIPKEDRERIFERFYRVDKARTRDSGGAGLGLAIVKHLVELHGGRVSVESKVGRGTRFTLFFKQA